MHLAKHTMFSKATAASQLSSDAMRLCYLHRKIKKSKQCWLYAKQNATGKKKLIGAMSSNTFLQIARSLKAEK